MENKIIYWGGKNMNMWVKYAAAGVVSLTVLIYIIVKLKTKGITREIRELVSQEKYHDALQLLNENKKLLSKEFYYISKMRCLNSLGEYKTCIFESRRALNSLGEHEEIYKILAQAYYWSGQCEKAAEAINISIAISDVEDFESYKLKAVYLWNTDKIQEALQALNKAFELGLDDDYLWFMRAKMNFKLGNFDEAINYYKQYLESSPENIHAIRELASTYFKLSRYDECIKMVNRLLELKPEDNTLNCELGKAYYYSGNFEEAMNCFDKVIETDNSFAEPYYFISKIYMKYNFVEDVFRFLKKAVLLDEAYRLKIYEDEDFHSLRYFSFYRDLIINPVEHASETEAAAAKSTKEGE
jgi:tetratricopeptide (TPR) repeat protein